ncbi:MAG TPA: hypothetical protein VJL08_03540 [Dehalococcoidia bacterium]|nr:hypothetical protein [Dehalococcoidia bacterium]
MTTETKLCVVCKKNEAARTCSECNIPLCDICAQDVHLQDVSPGSMVKPGVSTSPLRAGKTVKKVCPKCMAEADFM